ncbi:MAG: S8 family peptidase [Hespellia sp.]|nr:S8 family peptidase [Hespellia sp.]
MIIRREKGKIMKLVKEAIHYRCEDTGRYKGAGIGVAVMDTGISMHPDFGNRIVGFVDVIQGKSHPYDDCGHGTHVAGILAGDGAVSAGVYSGIAPEANLIVCKVLDKEGNGTVKQVVNGIRWIGAHYKEYGIRIVNISVGSKPDISAKSAAALVEGAEYLWDLGMVVVVSAGNYGPSRGSVAVPGVSKKIITVGAFDRDEQMKYSGRGPTRECVVKPDIFAPGTGIISCRGSGYGIKSGTSMATPVVSGAVAVLLSKYPQVSNVEAKLRLRSSATENRVIHIENLLK